MTTLGLKVWAPLVVAGLVGGGCASAPTQSSRTIEMDPMRFEVTQGANGPKVEVLDPELLFKEGNRAFEALNFRVASEKYLLVVERFPDSRYAGVSAYNGGLSLARDRQFKAAIPLFERVVNANKGSRDAQDALLQIGACYRTLERWDKLIEVANEVLKPHYDGLRPVERIEAIALRGFARQKKRDLALAERDYKQALAIYKKNLASLALKKSHHVSLAQFQIAEIYRELFHSIRFQLPVERMERDLEDKSNFFLKSQSGYLKALRLRHPDFATISGYRLGALYEDFYDDMMAAEIPGELSREQVDEYYGELKAKIRPLLVRAIDVYERNLRLGQRIGRADDWVTKTEASLARLKDVLRQESARDAEAVLRNSPSED